MGDPFAELPAVQGGLDLYPRLVRRVAAPVDQAHQVCPYSNAIRGNVEVTLTLA